MKFENLFIKNNKTCLFLFASKTKKASEYIINHKLYELVMSILERRKYLKPIKVESERELKNL